MSRSSLLTSVFFFSLIASASSVAENSRQLIQGLIYTLNPQQPVAEAVILENGRFQFVGKLDDALTLINDTTEVVELGDAVAYPGFIEGHGHLSSLGRSLASINLSNAENFEQIVEMVSQKAATLQPGEFVFGRGWHQSKWSSRPNPEVDGFPTHDKLSLVAPNNPVVLEHANGHTVLINQNAMQRANITAQTLAPEGGVIVLEKTSQPTGILHETAISLISELTTRSVASTRRSILNGQEHAFAHGITAFHDAGVDSVDVQAQQDLDASGELKLRLYSMLDANDSALIDQWLQRPLLIADSSSRLTIRSIKVVMDGALGSRTAWLHEPYTDDPATRGLPTFDADEFEALVTRAARAGWQVNTHAIGDKANTEVLDRIALAVSDPKSLRFRIEHAQHIRPSDVEKFKTLGIIASMQPIHMSSDRPWAIERLGQARIESGAYIWRSLIDAGVLIASGTDVPVEPINPIANFYAAITRKTLKGTPETGYEPRQKMTRLEALRAMTSNNAFAAFAEQNQGVIAVGNYADLTILSSDLLNVEEHKILDTKVMKTIVAGETVFSDY